ncbi:MAG: hypothetical protein M1820_006190 [Bogoriella megaspora]|nr:MAG: hypothetical protein M1820_006190 [Bogoriella megaspora]
MASLPTLLLNRREKALIKQAELLIPQVPIRLTNIDGTSSVDTKQYGGPLLKLYRTVYSNVSGTDWRPLNTPDSNTPHAEVSLLDQAREVAIQWSIKCDENLQFDVLIGAATDFIPRQFQRYSEPKMLTFKSSADRHESVAPVCLERGQGAEDRVLVLMDKSWQPLPVFLDKLAHQKRAESRLKSKQVVNIDRKRLQGRQGNRRKPFLLLDLPGEIRKHIYYMVWGPATVATKSGSLKPDLSLLYTCKFVYREASHTLSKEITFEFLDIRDPYRFFYQRRPGLRDNLQMQLKHQGIFGIAGRIQKVRLVFPPAQFLRFFGAKVGNDPKTNFNASRANVALHLLDLKSFELEIMHPKMMQACKWLQDSCHEVIVDWITQAAMPFVWDLPVKLTGCAKRSVKAAFGSAVQSYREAEDVLVDHEDAEDDPGAYEMPQRDGGLRRIRQAYVTASTLPPTCNERCQPHCSWYNMGIKYNPVDHPASADIGPN